MRLVKIVLAAIAVLVATAAPAATFSFSFAFPSAGIADIPGSTELASNQFVTTEVTIGAPTSLSLHRLRQTNSDNLLRGLVPVGTDVDLALGSNRFEVDDQAFNFAGELVATFTYSGGLQNSLGYAFDDGGPQLIFYADLPFRFFVDATATYEGIGPYVGSSDVIYIMLPLDDGLYRLQAAIPEPSTWAIVILGFGVVGLSLRRQPNRAPA